MGGSGQCQWPRHRRLIPVAVSLSVKSVIRGQPLLAKLDDLPHQMLGATMAMLKVVILGNE